MTTIQTKNKLIQCYHCSGTAFSNQLRAFTASTKKNVHLIDISKTMPSDTHWHGMAINLGISIGDMLNTQLLPNFDESAQYSEESWVKILAKNPEAFYGAIIIEKDRITHIKNHLEILKFFDIDSAGLEKTMHTETPVTSSKTNNETFI